MLKKTIAAALILTASLFAGSTVSSWDQKTNQGEILTDMFNVGVSAGGIWVYTYNDNRTPSCPTGNQNLPLRASYSITSSNYNVIVAAVLAAKAQGNLYMIVKEIPAGDPRRNDWNTFEILNVAVPTSK